MSKSKKMIAYEEARAKHKKVLLDFFILWQQEQETSRKLHSMVNGVDQCSSRLCNAYHALNPTEKKNIK